ncbi:TniB family NTP-binding protein [Mesorhizobium sp. ES1-4]|uniref:TniB family NTP-binding protein n=1 Tax=Mesorhizobium sp. ES1-4 TaxID=2876627 RepID=UPI001CCAB06E|nr:TniB family NTP-binding protein [Mesorhizobium sp. ES1-4]MBZ9797755.1 TniB family NTP-binding protein [Mesorhizobium sp. ES1-4]
MGETSDRLRAAQLPAAERQAILKRLIINHDRLAEGMDALSRFHMPVKGGVHDTGCVSAIVGDSRTGKSFAASAYARRFPPVPGDKGMILPVLLVETAPTGGLRPVLENLSNALGMLHSQRMNNALLTNNILEGLRYHDVQLLIFDEFQDVCDSRNVRLAVDVKRLLRKILNLDALNIVCIGLPETYEILANDKQLVGRGGLQHAHLHPYTWDSQEERMSFRLLCEKFDEGMPFQEKSGLGSASVAQRLHWISDGIIGKLKNFLFQAGCLAINDGCEHVTSEHFAMAYSAIKPPKTTFNPFVHDWSQIPAENSEIPLSSAQRALSKRSVSHA